MMRLALPGLACALALAPVGCGPMAAPLPVRLPDETQKEIDAGWARAFTPPARFDHQALLDLMVVAQPYQVGVDRLSFRSEKRFAGGTAVMDVQFDRAKPDDDRFTLTVTDPAGKVIRSERYTRDEVTAAVGALTGPLPPAGPNDPPEVAARQADRDARLKRIEEVFPPRKD